MHATLTAAARGMHLSSQLQQRRRQCSLHTAQQAAPGWQHNKLPQAGSMASCPRPSGALYSHDVSGARPYHHASGESTS